MNRLRVPLLLPALLVLTVACASANTQRPPSITAPEIAVDLSQEVFFGSGSTAPATLDVRVRNTSSEPIVVRRIEIDSPGMTEWGFPRQSRDFSETVAPGETKAITFFATARTITSRPNEPLSYRARFELESQGARWLEWVNIVNHTSPR